jgi:hypothetical protein
VNLQTFLPKKSHWAAAAPPRRGFFPQQLRAGSFVARDLPTIEAVTVDGRSSLLVRWRDTPAVDHVDLAGWIASGGDLLAPLKDPATFELVRVAAYGSVVAWDDDDLAIDAVHLKMLADQQRS